MPPYWFYHSLKRGFFDPFLAPLSQVSEEKIRTVVSAFALIHLFTRKFGAQWLLLAPEVALKKLIITINAQDHPMKQFISKNQLELDDAQKSQKIMSFSICSADIDAIRWVLSIQNLLSNFSIFLRHGKVSYLSPEQQQLIKYFSFIWPKNKAIWSYTGVYQGFIGFPPKCACYELLYNSETQKSLNVEHRILHGCKARIHRGEIHLKLTLLFCKPDLVPISMYPSPTLFQRKIRPHFWLFWHSRHGT